MTIGRRRLKVNVIGKQVLDPIHTARQTRQNSACQAVWSESGDSLSKSEQSLPFLLGGPQVWRSRRWCSDDCFPFVQIIFFAFVQLSWFVFDVKFVQMCACDMMRVLVTRRMAFSEEVVAYLDAAVINSHVILAYLCVWAPPRPTQSRHRTHLPIYCQRLSGGRAESIHTGQNCRACGTPPRQTQHRQDSFVGSSPAVWTGH